MLYVTTRNEKDIYTANHALSKNRSSDGGLYLPYLFPVLTQEQIGELYSKSFSQCVADILNMFFNARLDSHDVDFCIGRYPTKLVPMSHKIIIAETWHNPEADFNRVVRNLTSRVVGSDKSQSTPSNWSGIAVRIAVLFGLFAELNRNGVVGEEKKIDISVTAGDFLSPMAIWYARSMGLPIGTIVCGCNQNGSVWDLIHHGQLKTDVISVATMTPQCDCAIPENLERLIAATLNTDEVELFVKTCTKGGVYVLTDESSTALSAGLFAAVVSDRRMMNVINSVYRTCTYLLDPYAALAYGALQDYRAIAGETKPALIITEACPSCSAATVADAIGVPQQDLLAMIRMQ